MSNDFCQRLRHHFFQLLAVRIEWRCRSDGDIFWFGFPLLSISRIFENFLISFSYSTILSVLFHCRSILQLFTFFFFFDGSQFYSVVDWNRYISRQFSLFSMTRYGPLTRSAWSVWFSKSQRILYFSALKHILVNSLHSQSLFVCSVHNRSPFLPSHACFSFFFYFFSPLSLNKKHYFPIPCLF